MVEPQVGSLNILHYHHQLAVAAERGAGTAVRDIEHLCRTLLSATLSITSSMDRA